MIPAKGAWAEVTEGRGWGTADGTVMPRTFPPPCNQTYTVTGEQILDCLGFKVKPSGRLLTHVLNSHSNTFTLFYLSIWFFETSGSETKMLFLTGSKTGINHSQQARHLMLSGRQCIGFHTAQGINTSGLFSFLVPFSICRYF